MGSTTKKQTEANILSACKDLFFKYGLNKVTVEDICKEANISKMTFYRYFKNKSEAAKIFLQREQEAGFDKYRDIMDSDILFKDKVHQILLLKKENIKGVSKEFVQDIYQSKDKSLQLLIESASKKVINEMMKDFKTAQDRGEIRSDIKLEFIMYLLQDYQHKSLDPNLIRLYPNEEDLIMELINHFFYGILPTE